MEDFLAANNVTAQTMTTANLHSLGLLEEPPLSSLGEAKIYFDATLNKYRVSENGGAYVNLIP